MNIDNLTLGQIKQMCKKIDMREFKVGDKVYFPRYSTRIQTVRADGFTSSPHYKIAVCADGYCETFLPNGKMLSFVELPQIFHATEENKAKLEALYGVEFEKPPVKPTSKEIVQEMLARGDKYVCCWVDDFDENPTADNSWDYITDYMDDYYPFTISNGSGWKYATPFDPRTGEPITELPT